MSITLDLLKAAGGTTMLSRKPGTPVIPMLNSSDSLRLVSHD